MRNLQRFLVFIQDKSIEEIEKELAAYFRLTMDEIECIRKQGAYRKTYLVSKSIVIKVERNTTYYSTPENEVLPYFANLIEYYIWRLASSEQRKFLTPTIWISPNGRISICKRIHPYGHTTDDFNAFIEYCDQNFHYYFTSDLGWTNVLRNSLGKHKVVDYGIPEGGSETFYTAQDIVKFAKKCLNPASTYE